MDRDILIRAGGLSGVKQTELDALANTIAETIADEQVSIGTVAQTDPLGASLPEIVHVSLNFTGGGTAMTVNDATLRWARDAWQRHAAEPSAQILLVEIVNHKNDVLSRVVIKEPDGEARPYTDEVGPVGPDNKAPRWLHGPRSQPKVSTSKMCVFCGGKPLTKEHIWPKWARRKLTSTAQEPYWKERLVGPLSHVPQVTATGGEGRAYAEQHSAAPLYSMTTRSVCASCNGGWMSQLEEEARPILEAMLSRHGRTLHEDGQRILAAWAVKTALTFQQTLSPDRRLFPASDYSTLRESHEPSSMTRVWLSSYAGGQVSSATYQGLAGTADRHPIMYSTTITLGPVAFQVMGSGHTVLVAPAGFRDQPNIHGIWPFEDSFTWTPTPGLTDAGRREFAHALFASIHEQPGKTMPEQTWTGVQ